MKRNYSKRMNIFYFLTIVSKIILMTKTPVYAVNRREYFKAYLKTNLRYTAFSNSIIDKEINDLTKVINYNYTFINTLINDKKKVYDNSFLKSEINTFNATSRSNVDNKNKLTQQVNTIKNENS